MKHSRRSKLVILTTQRPVASPFRAFLLAVSLFVCLGFAAVIGQSYGAPVGAAAGIAGFVTCSLLNTKLQPACFANNFGVLNNTILIFDAFQQFLENLLPIRDIVLDTANEVTGSVRVKPGEIITVKDWRSAVTAYQPAAATGYNTLSNVAINAKDRQITIPNSPWAVSIALTPNEYRTLALGLTTGQAYFDLRAKLSNLMRDGLGKQAIADWFAVITAANYATNTVSATGTFTRSVEIDLDTTLFGRNVPSSSAIVIALPALYAEWAKDHIAIQTYTGENRPKGLLMAGGVSSQNSNLTFWRTNQAMPADADRGFAIAPTGVIAAFRIPDEETYENDPVSLAVQIDPNTKIPLLARLWKNATTGTMQLDLASIWVFAKGQVEAVERLTHV
jgi:hypothetical protein